MSVEPAPQLDLVPSRRLVDPKLVGLSLAGIVVVWMAFWSRAAPPVKQDWLPANEPRDVVVREGRGAADLYLAPETTIRLLVSSLGQSGHASTMTLSAESLTSTPVLRPLPVGVKDVIPRSDPMVAAPARRSPQSRTAGVVSRPSPATRDFWLHVTAEPLEDARGYQLVQGQLAVSRQTVQVYVDRCLLGTAGIPKAVQDLAADVAEELETSVLAEITSSIGPVDDADHDGRLTVLMSPWLGRLRGGETHVRGFVRSSDFREDIAAPFSNHADLLYLNAELPSGSALRTLLLHEVSHAALFSQPRGPKSLAKAREWDDWLNEGLAHLSERKGGGDWSNIDYRIAQFCQRPERAPLVVTDYYRSGRWRDHGCRGATFLFLDWCAQRFRQQNQSEFVPAVVATGLPGSAAIAQVMGQDFDELYRAWTVSLVTPQDTSRPRIGRFVASGPRLATWDVSSATTHQCEVCGTATRFIELRAARPGWYRVSFKGDRQQAWQVTLVNSLSIRPSIDVQSAWNTDDSNQLADLVVSTVHPLPVGWQLDLLACEQLGDRRPRSRDWLSNELTSVSRPDHTGWHVPGSAIALSEDPGLSSPPVTIKVRWKHATGMTTWSWCDVPPRIRPHSTMAEKIVSLPEARVR